LHKGADKSALRPHGINEQAPFLELLAGLIEGLGYLYLRKDMPVCVSDFAHKISHGTSLPQSHGCLKLGANPLARKGTFQMYAPKSGRPRSAQKGPCPYLIRPRKVGKGSLVRGQTCPFIHYGDARGCTEVEH
jgi:hypothetical protein